MKTFKNQQELPEESAEEIWKKSPLALDTMKVSNLGRVWRCEIITTTLKKGVLSRQRKKETYLTPWLSKTGYLMISTKQDGRTYKYLLHRLIASVFVEGFHSKLSVNHINGIKTDNRIENLEWVTLAKNTSLEWKTKLISRGESYKFSKLKDLEVIDIKKSKIKISELANKYKVSESLIYKIKQGIRRKYLNEAI